MSKTPKPWQMTRTEWMEVRPAGTSPGMHYVYVKQALNRGRPELARYYYSTWFTTYKAPTGSTRRYKSPALPCRRTREKEADAS